MAKKALNSEKKLRSYIENSEVVSDVGSISLITQ